jgi:hypothetical protein
MKITIIFYSMIILIYSCQKNQKISDRSQKIIDEARIIDKQMEENASVISKAIDIKGKIIAAKNFRDFPEVTNAIIKLNLQTRANQLLVVNVGQTALVVTTNSAFSTTGYFNMKTIKLMNTSTTMGEIPVFIEMTNYDDLISNFKKNDDDVRKLGVQFIKEEISTNLKNAKDIKEKNKSILSPEDIASLISLNRLGDMNDIGFAFYNFHNVATLCKIQESLKDQNTWINEFQKIKYEITKKESLPLLVSDWCMDSPMKKKNSILSFKECMCRTHFTDDFNIRKYSQSTEYEELKEFKENNRSIASEK